MRMVRFKNRYIALEITPVDKSERPLVLKTIALQNAIQQKVQQLYGDYGSAVAKEGFNAKYCNTHTRIALVKIRHGPHNFLIKSIPLINDVGGTYVKVDIIYIGATMKHCFLFLRKYQQKRLEQMWGDLKTEMQRKQMADALMTLTPAMKNFK